MPLIHSKKPKAFSENIRTEMRHGKPQKQAVAIAYRMAGEAKDHKCMGGECEHESHYAEGGAVDSWTKREDNEKGVHRSAATHENKGRSTAGAALHPAYSIAEDLDVDSAKRKHHKVLGEMRSMKKPNLYAEGGEVMDSPEHPDAHEDKELIDSELHDMMGEELMSAIDNKDKKRIMESLEAIVLQCMNKE